MSRLIEFVKRASHSQCGANAADQRGTLLYGLGVSQVMVVYVPLVDNHDEDEMAAKFFMACECDCYGFGGGATQPKHPDRRPLANKGTPEYEANGNADKSGKKANLQIDSSSIQCQVISAEGSDPVPHAKGCLLPLRPGTHEWPEVCQQAHLSPQVEAR